MKSNRFKEAFRQAEGIVCFSSKLQIESQETVMLMKLGELAQVFSIFFVVLTNSILYTMLASISNDKN
jgi:hypothetical protein